MRIQECLETLHLLVGCLCTDTTFAVTQGHGWNSVFVFKDDKGTSLEVMIAAKYIASYGTCVTYKKKTYVGPCNGLIGFSIFWNE